VKPRVLVVEDEPALLKVLVMRLQIEGFEVRAATDGAEALELIAAERPDLVLADLMMPVMDGVELTRQIKGNPKLKAIPVLILTALRSRKETQTLEALGVDGIARKPYDSKQLTALMRELLQS